MAYSDGARWAGEPRVVSAPPNEHDYRYIAKTPSLTIREATFDSPGTLYVYPNHPAATQGTWTVSASNYYQRTYAAQVLMSHDAHRSGTQWYFIVLCNAFTSGTLRIRYFAGVSKQNCAANILASCSQDTPTRLITVRGVTKFSFTTPHTNPEWTNFAGLTNVDVLTPTDWYITMPTGCLVLDWLTYSAPNGTPAQLLGFTSAADDMQCVAPNTYIDAERRDPVFPSTAKQSQRRSSSPESYEHVDGAESEINIRAEFTKPFEMFSPDLRLIIDDINVGVDECLSINDTLKTFHYVGETFEVGNSDNKYSINFAVTPRMPYVVAFDGLATNKVEVYDKYTGSYTWNNPFQHTNAHRDDANSDPVAQWATMYCFYAGGRRYLINVGYDNSIVSCQPPLAIAQWILDYKTTNLDASRPTALFDTLSNPNILVEVPWRSQYFYEQVFDSGYGTGSSYAEEGAQATLNLAIVHRDFDGVIPFTASWYASVADDFHFMWLRNPIIFNYETGDKIKPRFREIRGGPRVNPREMAIAREMEKIAIQEEAKRRYEEQRNKREISAATNHRETPKARK
jgi:hypothetical protein